MQGTSARNLICPNTDRNTLAVSSVTAIKSCPISPTSLGCEAFLLARFLFCQPLGPVCEASSGARGNKPLNAAFGHAECGMVRGQVLAKSVEKQTMRRLWREKLLCMCIKYSFRTGKIIARKACQRWVCYFVNDGPPARSGCWTFQPRFQPGLSVTSAARRNVDAR